MITLTPKQKSLLDTIISFRKEHGYSPTYQELANALNIKHVNSICHLIIELEKKGCIKTSNNRWRSIEIPRLENGGFPSHGSMFIAGENGPEIVGHIGSKTEVLNGSQISGAIYNAVSMAMKENNSSAKQDIRVYAEDGLLVEKVSRGINQHVKQTGSLPFTIPI